MKCAMALSRLVKWSLAAVVLLGGCATYHIVTGPDGQSAMRVSCRRDNPYGCDARAHRICGPSGYQLLDNGTRFGTFVTPNGYVVPNQMVFQGFIIFRCH